MTSEVNMIVHMRKLDDSVFVDLVYFIKVIFDLICQSLNSYLLYTNIILQTKHFEKYTYACIVAPVRYIPIYAYYSVLYTYV